MLHLFFVKRIKKEKAWRCNCKPMLMSRRGNQIRKTLFSRNSFASAARMGGEWSERCNSATTSERFKHKNEGTSEAMIFGMDRGVLRIETCLCSLPVLIDTVLFLQQLLIALDFPQQHTLCSKPAKDTACSLLPQKCTLNVAPETEATYSSIRKEAIKRFIRTLKLSYISESPNIFGTLV